MTRHHTSIVRVSPSDSRREVLQQIHIAVILGQGWQAVFRTILTFYIQLYVCMCLCYQEFDWSGPLEHPTYMCMCMYICMLVFIYLFIYLLIYLFIRASLSEGGTRSGWMRILRSRHELSHGVVDRGITHCDSKIAQESIIQQGWMYV
jgi:hypothetical protein